MMPLRSQRIHKKRLQNGLTVLVYPEQHIPRVSTQLWYRVGSRHEAIGQKGMAHLLEHMMFKGTKKLSESDINLITYKLSGSCNAFTSHDYTGYLFDLPSQNWQKSFVLFADCMHNCTFKQELLNCELKAVIQELKMYRDNYSACIIEELFGVLFAGHPYNYPIVGFKHDLWNLSRDHLLDFYHTYYAPNNATLIVVGDVVVNDVFDQAEQVFAKLKPSKIPPLAEAYVRRDLVNRSVTLYRDVQNPFITCAFLVPGACAKQDYALDVLAWVLGAGRGSRLYTVLVEQLKLAVEVDAFCYDLFEYGILFVQVQPKKAQSITRIIEQIKTIVQQLIDKGVSAADLERGQAKANTAYYALFEENQRLAYSLGRSFLATGDEHYLLHYQLSGRDQLQNQINEIVKNYIRPELMAVGSVLPLAAQDRAYWTMLQEESDKQDRCVLADKKRSCAIEDGVAVHHIKPHTFIPFKFPAYESFVLPNGLEVLSYCDTRVPKIEALLELETDHLYDPDKKLGLANVVSQLLLKGTKKHSAVQLAQAIERRGMSLEIMPGLVSLGMQSRDCEQGFALVNEVLTKASLEAVALADVKHKVKTTIDDYWDEPLQFCSQLIRNHLYAHHPYCKNALGTKRTVAAINRSDVAQYVQRSLTPHGSRLAVVGDFTGINLKQVLEDAFGDWQGAPVDDLNYPVLKLIKKHEINHRINRDQVVLAFAGLSLAHTDHDYDKVLLIDQVFGGGVLGAMNSRLFALREQSGLFYTIAGSLLAKADKQPGMVMVRTLVSLDRLAEAEKAIKHIIGSFVETVTDDEFEQARNAVVNSLADNFETYKQIAATFLYMRRFNRPKDYFDKRAERLMHIKRDDARSAAVKLTDLEHMITVRIGRV